MKGSNGTAGDARGPVVGRRDTRRKRLIREMLATEYAGRAVLLDELRWAVFSADGAVRAAESTAIERSWLNSFARTIREQFPDYRIQKVRLDETTPIGIVARSAVYRLKDPEELRGFLNARDPCVLCRYTTNMEFEEPRYQWRYVVPCRYAASFRFFSRLPTEISYSTISQIPGTLIPGTHKLSIIVPPRMTVTPESLAAVPWKLFAYDDLSAWRQVDPTVGLGAVQRNRYL